MLSLKEQILEEIRKEKSSRGRKQEMLPIKDQM